MWEDGASQQFGEDLIQTMRKLRRYALWLSESASLADDLMQEAMLNAWKARGRFEYGTNLNAWCRTILRNVHISNMRRNWRILPLTDETIAAIPETVGDFAVALDLLAVRNAMTLLPIEQREALLLIGAGGMSYLEAARITECAVGTMKSRVSRARSQLATLMAENRAGFNSDAGLRAGDAIADLMHQVDLIKSRAPDECGSSEVSESVVLIQSEAQPYEQPMLRTG